MLDSETINLKVEKIKIYARQLKTIQKGGKKKVCSDEILSAAMERFLQLAAESVLDVGGHIISSKGFKKPTTYQDIMPILADEKIVTKKLMSSCKNLALIRNQLVHDIGEVDKEKIFDWAKELIPALEDSVKVYQKQI